MLKVNFGIYPRQPLHPPQTSFCLHFPFGHTAPHQWWCCVLNTGCVFYEQFPLSLGWHCHANSLGILLKIKVVPVTSSLCLCMGPYKGGMITIMRYCLMRVSNTARNGDIFIKVEWLSPTDTVRIVIHTSFVFICTREEPLVWLQLNIKGTHSSAWINLINQSAWLSRNSFYPSGTPSSPNNANAEYDASYAICDDFFLFFFNQIQQ